MLSIKDTTYSNVPAGVDFKPTHCVTWGSHQGVDGCFTTNLINGKRTFTPMVFGLSNDFIQERWGQSLGENGEIDIELFDTLAWLGNVKIIFNLNGKS